MTSLLNPEQELAVQHIEGPMLVLAGAGSGKTRIVTHRIVHLLQMGIPASEILALTFTNKAAEEMRYRIRQLSDRFVLTCTFHSLFAKILRESIHEIGFNNRFSIYDEDDSLSLIKTCLKTLNYPDERSTVKAMKQAISHAKNGLKSPGELEKPSFPSHEFKMMQETYALYQQKLKEYNALDFDDLLFQCVHLLRASPPTLQMYQKRWSFVLIDEYQDTNMAQYVLTRLLVEKHHNLFVVGDPDQSIYSWRGANIHNILNFEQDFAGAKVVKLEQNYRSTEHILSAANSLIAHNTSRYKKELWSTLGAGDKVHIHLYNNEQEEAISVTKTISHYKKEGISLGNMAIFYRTNAQSRALEDRLLKEKIPYILIGGISFYQRKEIKDMLSLLRVACSPSDFLSFARTINLPKRGLGLATLEKLKEHATLHATPIITLCQALLKQKNTQGELKLSPKQAASLQEYLHVLHTIQEEKTGKLPLKDLLKNAIERSRYLDHLKEDPETFEDRKANLDELIATSAEWQQENPELSLEEFLEELSLKSSVDNPHHMYESVKLMTLHHGKGLEFALAFIVGLEEDMLPHLNAKESPEALEEERRLCYVGMTRAKRHLYMSASRYRLVWGAPRIMQPSRFLQELDPQHLDWPTEKEVTVSDSLPIGTQVVHKDFGQGVIQKSYTTSLGATYDVFFPHLRTTKSLVAKFAKLQVL